MPVFAFSDRISFDGRALRRTGVIPRLWTWLNGGRRRLKLSDVEQVETYVLRGWKRAGVVRYRYRTSLRGKDVDLVIVSGGASYRQMIREILSQLPTDALDIRSLDLREYLNDPKEVVMKAEFARLPSNDLLADELRGPRSRSTTQVADVAEETVDLQELGNELRVAGHLARSVEAVRRALRSRPRDAALIFDLSRSLRSFSQVGRSDRLRRRAVAALRLAESRAETDGLLLTRIGETYSQINDPLRAARAFRRAGSSLRAAKGLAETALHDGKLAHVIHHFSAAYRDADTPALRRWARGEDEYFTHLNSDDEYMETEIRRVKMLDSVEAAKRTCLRISFLAFPAITVGVIFEDTLVANLGWAISGVSLVIWTGLIFMSRLLARRIPYELMPDDD
jgi:tetratricopeptide (TPR) repeat protein